MKPLGLAITLFLAAIVFFSSRMRALLAVIASICYLTQYQQIDLGFHCTAVRLVVLAGIIRVFVRGEFREVSFNRIDKMVLAYVIVLVLIGAGGRGTAIALVNFIGAAYNVLLPYFLFRCLLRNYDESKEFLAKFAILVVPLACMLVLEALKGRSIFTELGLLSVRLEERGSYFRAQGPFRSPITAGTFGATFVPIFACLCFDGTIRRRALVGLTAAVIITAASHSSGPLMELITGLIAVAFWRWREQMQTVRRAMVFLLIALALVMKAPVWYIFSRASDIFGGGGWHRSAIIDQAYKHFGSWWLVGTDDTADWMPYHLQNGDSDITNQFLQAGVSGGLLTMGLFIWIIVRCFQNLGWVRREVQGIFPAFEWYLWGLGCALAATVVNFFAVTYFDQVEEILYLLIAMISACAVPESAALNNEERKGHDTLLNPEGPVSEISIAELKITQLSV